MYDLKIVFPSDRIENMYLVENAYEKEIVGGNISGYPLLYKSKNMNEPIDCDKNKEETNETYNVINKFLGDNNE